MTSEVNKAGRRIHAPLQMVAFSCSFSTCGIEKHFRVSWLPPLTDLHFPTFPTHQSFLLLNNSNTAQLFGVKLTITLVTGGAEF